MLTGTASPQKPRGRRTRGKASSTGQAPNRSGGRRFHQKQKSLQQFNPFGSSTKNKKKKPKKILHPFSTHNKGPTTLNHSYNSRQFEPKINNFK
jgi:hypothetical protein